MICKNFMLLVLLCAALLLAAPGWAQSPEDDQGAQAAERKDEKKDEQKDEKKPLPLKPERKFELTTSEGTWLSLDVSSDGKTIVFELLGGVYTLPVEGGEAKLVSNSGGMAFESQPRFSPDGKWIAFLSDRDGAENLWIMKTDGSEPKQLTKDQNSEFASPAWTPDGQYVLVSRSGWGLRTYEIWMYHIKGGSGVQITRAKPTPTTPPAQRPNTLGVAVSPDGRYFYYARRTGGFQYNAMMPLWQLARRDRRTGDEDIITQGQASAFRPVLSPDGSKLVYGTRLETETGLRIRDLRTGEDKWLKVPVQRDDQESRFTRDLLPGYAFLPNGRELVLSYAGNLWRLDIQTRNAQPINWSAKISRDLGPRLHFPWRVEQGAVRARLIQGPVASADGKRLAFSGLTHLYVSDLPAGPCPEACNVTPRRITTGDAREFGPAWSPDGQWLAYVTWSASGGHIWKTRADGSGAPQQLTRVPAFYSDVNWTPDGARLVALRGSMKYRLESPFAFGQTPGMDLVWLPAEGGDATVIIPSRGIGRPHFVEKEKDRIFLYSNQGLLSLRFDGTDRRNLLRVTGTGNYAAEEPVPASEVRASPDGNWALAEVMNQLYLIALPQDVGAEAPMVNVNTPSVPVKKITDVGADYFDWMDGGKTLSWAIGASFFRQPLETVSFDPPKKEEPKPDEKKPSADPKAAAPGGGCGIPATPPAQKAEEKKKPSDAVETAVVLEFPRKTPTGTIILRGATVITMNGDEVFTDADVVVTDNRITSVGKRGAVPAGARVFDVKGKTIVPGFVDTHAHWFEIRRGVLDIQNWSFLANLAFGVTAGLDVQTASNDMFAYQDLVDMGEILGPRAYSTGPGIFSDNAFKSVDEVKGVLRRYKNYYRTHNLKSYIVGNRKQRQWMVEAAKELQLMPTTEGGLDLKLDLTHVIDGFSGNEHTLPIAPLFKDVVDLVAQSKIAYTPTLIVAYGGPFAENDFYESTEVHDNPRLNRFTPHNVLDGKTKRRPFWFRKDEYSYPLMAQQAAKIQRAGGWVGVGSHGQLQGLGYHWEMWALASGGMKPIEVLRAATRDGAEMIGAGQDLGTLQPGKLADLVVLDKNPLENIKNTNTVRWVMKNGELFEGETLNQLWPEQKPLPPLWWWTADKP